MTSEKSKIPETEEAPKSGLIVDKGMIGALLCPILPFLAVVSKAMTPPEDSITTQMLWWETPAILFPALTVSLLLGLLANTSQSRWARGIGSCMTTIVVLLMITAGMLIFVL